MKNLIPIIALLLLFSCKSKDDQDNLIPDCIQEQIENEATLMAVLTQEVDGEIHYWLNTGVLSLDGTEFIVNNNCEEVCQFCGLCVPPNCNDDYNADEWTVIWEQ